MRFDYIDFIIPTIYITAIEYDDRSRLNDEDIKNLDEFLKTLPLACTFIYDEDEYFSYGNDIDRYGNTVVDAKCYYPIKEEN